MANRWGNNRNSDKIYFGGSNITWDGDCSHKIKRRLLLGKKSMINLESVLKSWHIKTNVHLVKTMAFPVVMYGCESWTIKKAEHQIIDAFDLWCWRRFLRVLWAARRSNQSILKEISSEYLLEGLMLKLKLQYFGHLMRRADSSEKTLMLGKTEGRRRREGQRMRWLDGITDWKMIEPLLMGHRGGDAIQSSHPLSSPSPPAFSLSQHQGLFQWVSSSHRVAKVLEFQLQHQSF